MYRTDTKINKSKSGYKIFTTKIVDELENNINLFNSISKVSKIYSIDRDFDNDMIHINFDYFGNSKPNGKAISRLVTLCNFPLNLTFDHFFYHSLEKRKEYLQKPETKALYNELVKKNNKKPENKERIRKYQAEYSKKYYSKQENKEKRKEYQRKSDARPERKARKAKLQKERQQNQEFKDKRNYRNYLNYHNLSEKDLSLDDFLNLQKDFNYNKERLKGEKLKQRKEENAIKRGFKSDAEYQRFRRAKLKNNDLTINDFRNI